MLLRKCDRCSEVIDEYQKEMVITQRYTMMPKQEILNIDLCDKCFEKLKNFLNEVKVEE